MKREEVLKMNREERLRKLEELRVELVKLYLQAKMGLLKDTSKIRNTRRDIARILTVVNSEKKKESAAT
ncbi:MAG: 50S ribosomal protein L29 [Desulfurococcaceae archaeon]